MFLAAAAAGAAALIAGWFCTIPEPELSDAERKQMRSWEASTFVDAGSLKVGAVGGLAGFAVAGVMGFIALHTEQLGIPGAASLFFVAYALASLAARLVAGRLQDLHGDNIVILPVFALFVLGLVLLAVGQSTPYGGARGSVFSSAPASGTPRTGHHRVRVPRNVSCCWCARGPRGSGYYFVMQRERLRG